MFVTSCAGVKVLKSFSLYKVPVLWAVSVLLASQVYSPRANAVPTVNALDLGRYLGKWYEVASIPAWFQKKCVKNTTAEYSSLDFGRIDVVNSCDKADGSLNVANGVAHVVNTTTNAELEVSFVPLLSFFGWFSGQYKVIALGANYEYSVVGDDTLGFGWILSRTPSLPLQTLVDLEKKISAVGYDSCQFLMSLQDGAAITTRTPLCQIVR